jgi:hypothetical protein
MTTDSESHYQRYLARKRQKLQSGQAKPPKLGESLARMWQLAQMAQAPIHECLVPEGLFEQGIGNLAFSRMLPDGQIALAVFLLDVFCLGVKNAFLTIVAKDVYGERRRHWSGPENLKPMPPACFRKLVEGGVAYAGELGFSPHADYAEACRIFGEVDPAACQTKFEYGREGKPFYISGPNETPAQAQRIVEQLGRRLGADNFDWLLAL